MGEQRKRQRTDSMAKAINQKKESKLWYEEANSHVKAGNLEKAVLAYNKALELNPTEKNALVARSKCYILLGHPAKALEDAEMALDLDKSFLRAIYQKAESLYHLGNFEYSLMYFHRGLHIRPDHEQFKLGVHKSQKAIENAIGGPSLFGPRRESKQNSELPTHRTGTSNSMSSKRVTPVNRSRSSKSSRLLRELGADKDYLDNLLRNPDIKCKFKEDDDTIKRNVEETVEYLEARQEFWRQQLPPHLR